MVDAIGSCSRAAGSSSTASTAGTRAHGRRAMSRSRRARRHAAYEGWILDEVVPWITGDAGGAAEILLTGVSFGAYHAANFALKRADRFPLAICRSGVYDVSGVGWGERGDAVYFNNPMDYVGHLHGDHLTWLRDRVSIVLVCGSGQWEDTTGARARAASRGSRRQGIRRDRRLGPEFARLAP